MKFCPDCGSFCTPSYNIKQAVCIKCGLKVELDTPLSLTNNKMTDEKIVVVNREMKNITGLPVERKKCPKCGNLKATVSMAAARSEEDYETEKFRCTECSHTWRDSN